MIGLSEISQAGKGLEPEMFECLRTMVEIQSSSRNKAGVDRLGAFIRTRVADLPVRVETVAQPVYGDHLLMRSACRIPHDRGILLVGHLDTVFPEDTGFTRFTEDDRCCYGPGVIDMKGGLVVGLFALRILDMLGRLKELPITFIMNSDEERGSPTSTELILHHARQSGFAIVLEAGGLDNAIVTGRKGNMRLELTVEGIAGHAAFAGRDKPSAILGLARLIIALEGLNDPDRGITVNVGTVRGGIGHNTVAANAEALVDLRFKDAAQRDFLLQAVERLIAAPEVGGTTGRYQIKSQRPPMVITPATAELFGVFAELGRRAGIHIREEFRVGVSDANTVAAAGIPVLDGLGPLGGDDHSEREYMIKASLVQRTILLAAGILGCWQRRLDQG